MSGTIIYGPGSGGNACFPSIEVSGCGPVCEPSVSCCQIAPCKTRLRDAITMLPREVEHSFSLTEVGCNGTQIPVVVTKIGMVLRRRGGCQQIACLAPLRTTLDGYVVFRWPDSFLGCAPGQYEGDVYVNGVEVGSVLLIKPDQTAVVGDEGAGEADFPCGECACGSADCAVCGDYAEPDGTPISHESCGGCVTC